VVVIIQDCASESKEGISRSGSPPDPIGHNQIVFTVADGQLSPARHDHPDLLDRLVLWMQGTGRYLCALNGCGSCLWPDGWDHRQGYVFVSLGLLCSSPIMC
jgi:hypothetical protein